MVLRSRVTKPTVDKGLQSVPGRPLVKDFTNQRYRWRKRIDEPVKATNRRKSSVRAKVEHVVGVTGGNCSARRISSRCEGDCCMRRARLGERCRGRTCEDAYKNVPAEIRICAFITSSSDLPDTAVKDTICCDR